MPTCTKVALADYVSQSQAQATLSTSILQYQEVTATQFWVVNYDSPANCILALIATDGTNTIPSIGQSHPDDSSLYVNKVQAKPNGDTAQSFLVEVDYSDQVQQNPLEVPAAIAWDFDEATQPYFLDNDPSGPKPCVNSAGEPFETLLEREAGKIKCTIVKNQASYNPTQAVTYSEAVNSDSFSLDGVTISEGQAKMKAITGGAKTTVNIGGTDVTYRPVTYTIHFREDWNDVIEDRGYHESDGSGKLKEINKGTPPIKPDKPWPLDGSGGAKPNATDTPETITFYPYSTQPFSTFSSYWS